MHELNMKSSNGVFPMYLTIDEFDTLMHNLHA